MSESRSKSSPGAVASPSTPASLSAWLKSTTAVQQSKMLPEKVAELRARAAAQQSAVRSAKSCARLERTSYLAQSMVSPTLRNLASATPEEAATSSSAMLQRAQQLKSSLASAPRSAPPPLARAALGGLLPLPPVRESSDLAREDAEADAALDALEQSMSRDDRTYVPYASAGGAFVPTPAPPAPPMGFGSASPAFGGSPAFGALPRWASSEEGSGGAPSAVFGGVPPENRSAIAQYQRRQAREQEFAPMVSAAPAQIAFGAPAGGVFGFGGFGGAGGAPQSRVEVLPPHLQEIRELLEQMKVEPVEDVETATKFKLFEGLQDTVSATRDAVHAFWLESSSHFAGAAKSSAEREIRALDDSNAMQIEERPGVWFVYFMCIKAYENATAIRQLLAALRARLELLSKDDGECPCCLADIEEDECETLGCCHKVCKPCWTHWKMVKEQQGQHPFCPLCKHDEFVQDVMQAAGSDA